MLMLKQLFIGMVMVAGGNLSALAAEDTIQQETTPPTYSELRLAYQQALDRCDLINTQEVLALGTTPVANIDDEPEKWKTLLKETREARLACYEKAQAVLEEAIAAGMEKLQQEEENTALAARLELDKQAADLIEVRRELTRQLMDNMLADLEQTLEKYNKTWRKKDKPSFVMESDETADLIRQDMAIVLELERRELNLEARLIHNQPDNDETLIKLKLREALHYLTRALMAYEDINRTNPARLLANLRSEYLYSAGQMHEVLAIAPDLKPLPEFIRPRLMQLVNRMQLLELDVEGALRDFRAGVMEQSVEDWLSELYQDLSNLSIEINNVLRRLEIGEPIVVQDDGEMDIPDDIAAFIEEDATKEAAKAAEPDAESEKPEE